jgi:hypothetical protein
MYINKTLSLYRLTPGSTDDSGVYHPGTAEFVRNVPMDFQPYSRELLKKDYGFDVDVTQRLFIRDASDVDLGMQFREGSTVYEVRKTVPWDNYSEVMVYELP